MAHTLQERYSSLVDEKLRNTLVTKDGIIFNNRYEGDPKAGKVKIPVRDTEVEVKTYNKQTGASISQGSTVLLLSNTLYPAILPTAPFCTSSCERSP